MLLKYSCTAYCGKFISAIKEVGVQTAPCNYFNCKLICWWLQSSQKARLHVCNAVWAPAPVSEPMIACLFVSSQVWWHDSGSQRPVDSRNEPLGPGAHAERAAQPGGAYCSLLARQPGIAGPDREQAAHSIESTQNVLYWERPWPKWTGTCYCTSLHIGLNPGPNAFRTTEDPAGPKPVLTRWELIQIVPRHATDCTLTHTAVIIWSCCLHSHRENSTATVNRRSVLYSPHQAVVESRAIFRWMHRCR